MKTYKKKSDDLEIGGLYNIFFYSEEGSSKNTIYVDCGMYIGMQHSTVFGIVYKFFLGAKTISYMVYSSVFYRFIRLDKP